MTWTEGVLVIDDEVHFRYFLRVSGWVRREDGLNGSKRWTCLPWRPDVITLTPRCRSKAPDLYAVCQRDWKRIPVVMLSAGRSPSGNSVPLIGLT
ncbi:MAG: hypothetical protein ACLTTU_16095 [Bilophila wadsworthia]